MATRILFVIGSLEVGGTQKHLIELAAAITRRDWNANVYCLVREGALADELRRHGVTVRAPWLQNRGPALTRSLPGRALRLTLAAGGLMAELLIRRPAIIHFFLPENYVVGGICALIARCPRLVMSRRSLNLYYGRRPILRPIERFLHRHMTRIIGNSRAVIEELRGEGVSEDKLRLIYNGVELPSSPTQATRLMTRQDLGVPTDAFVMIIVANLIPYKGHADLLEALSRIRERLPQPWRLLCIGRDEGPGNALRAQATRLGIADKVAWLGLRADAAALYAAADVGLLVSHEEGFSNAVLEGMAAGIPMIVTDVGGNADAVINGKTGLVVPPRDPDRLGLAILSLAADSKRAAEMAAAGRDRAAQNFSLATCVGEYEKLYAELLVR